MTSSLRRRTVAVLCLALVLSGCSDDPPADRAGEVSEGSVTSAPAAPSAAPTVVTSAAAPVPAGVTAVPAPGTTSSGLPSRTSPTPLSSAPPGPAARRYATAPGRYTLDVRGSSRSDLAPSAQPNNGEATLTVDPPRGDDQHSTLHAGRHGSSEQTVRFTPSAIQLVQLRITTPGFSKEFRPVEPVLLLPQPPTVGRSWSWVVVSTDGATTASVEAKVTRTETLVIGGERVATTVVHSTLRLSGDITATSVMDTWYADRYRLVAKEHSVTDGQVQGITFHDDTTSTLRSTKPE